MDEKMDETFTEHKKSPLGAVILSVMFPGFGLVYLGNVIKGITYMMVFAALIVLASHGKDAEIPILVLICLGFYIYQLFDCLDEAKKMKLKATKTGPEKTEQNISLSAAVFILVLGIVLQMATLDIISFRDVLRLWPLVLIAIGLKYLYMYMKSKETNEKEMNDNETNGGGSHE